ncbi:MAG: hypothetical protein GY827_12760 [Cytophagales bacterium]|nr:hypothetical protein [Cytophagales bacterium]
MKKTFIIISSLLALLFITSCTTIPQSEFRTYLSSFDEFKKVNEQTIIDLDHAQKIKNKTSKKTSTFSGVSIPSTVSILSEIEVKRDEISIRKEALEVIDSYNALLTELAAGKSPQEVKASVDSLSSSLKSLSELSSKVSFALPPGVDSLISTVLSKLEEAQNRQNFKEAIKEGQPIIDKMLTLFIKDAQDTYAIHSGSLIKRRKDIKLVIANLQGQIHGVSIEYKAPTGGIKTKFDKLEKKLVETLKKSPNLKIVKIKFTPASNKDFDITTLSQLEQTYVQINSKTKELLDLQKEQQNRYNFAISYGHLVKKVQQTIKVTSIAIDNPQTINESAKEIFAFAFEVKRNIEAIKNQ